MFGVIRHALCMVALTIVVPAVAYAQASITGTVRDSSGGILPGVTVEASSPVLIEQVRSVVTDGSGQYRVIDLRPGTYAVTFTLPGFNTVRREGIELTGDFVATVNVELRVGAVEETITVTAESPIVDVQRTTAQRVFTQEVIETIPAGRSHINQIVLIPGLSASQPGRGALADVGGTNNLQNTMFVIHGSRQSDTRLQMDGVRVGNVLSEGQFSNWVPDTSSTQEVTVDYGAVSAEQPFGGLRINIVPREGGNSFRGTVFGTGVNSSWQGDNLSEELIDRGLPEPNRMKRAYDVNPSVGGPIFRDRLWFYTSARWQQNQNYIAGLYHNANAGTDSWQYVPDLSRQGFFSLTQNSINTRLTWQAAQKHKVTFYADNQSRVWDDSRPGVSPESTVAYRFPKLSMGQVGWTSPLTNRVLLEARFANRQEAFGNQLPAAGDIYRSLIPAIDQATGMQYRGKGGNGGVGGTFGYSSQNINTANASMAYVTGSHSFKVGVSNTWSETKSATDTNEHAMLFRIGANGFPNQLTMYAQPTRSGTKVLAELGVFAQDQWTIDRLTLSMGVRYDHFKGGYPEQYRGPNVFLPTRDITFPAVTGNSLHDITPRVGMAYDLFGTGRTALKVNLGKYPLAVTPVGNPAGVTAQTTRNFTDANQNYWPDCDLTNFLANGECGTVANLNFGLPTSVAEFNPDTRFGWGNRPWSAEFSTSIQHQLVPRVGMDVGYFRRWYGNFITTQNRATTAADFDPFSVVAPSDPRLPGGGGYTIEGLYNLSEGKVGQVNNYTTFASDFGKQIEYWQGVDISVNARMQQGVLLQGGVSTGRTVTDNCEIAANSGGNPSQLYCRQVTNFLTQVKLLGSYLIPVGGVQVAATFQSSPGPQIIANRLFTNAEVFPTLGRNLSGGAANTTVNMVAPGTMYGDRVHQLDMRFSRPIRFDRYRLSLNLDIANLLNENPVMQQNNNYAVWQLPQRIMDARMFKVSAQFDF